MSKIEEREYWVPEHVREYLRGLGFVLPLEAMESHIRNWHAWMQATGTSMIIATRLGSGGSTRCSNRVPQEVHVHVRTGLTSPNNGISKFEQIGAFRAGFSDFAPFHDFPVYQAFHDFRFRAIPQF